MEDKYTAALERAKPYYPDNLFLDTIFPELCESEDEKIATRLIHLIHTGGYLEEPSRTRILAWLEKQKEQKPEWSNEDEMMVRCCLKAINYYGEDSPRGILPPRFDIDGYLASVDTVKDWLKSLRFQPRWKPSEEQMEALLWCTAHLGGADHRVLAELYEHLKKLKED